MFPYIIVSFLFIAYLEVLGQWFLSKLNKEFKISFPFGFLLLMGYGYLTTAIPSSLQWSFNYLVIVYALFFLISLVLIIKDFKKVKWHISITSWLVIILCCSILVYYSYNTTLGNLNGFDSVYYFNLITSNINSSMLNSTSPLAGNNHGKLEVNYQYTFQSYFYFVSVFVYFVKTLLRKLTFDVYYVDLIAWVFQIVYNCFFLSLVINALDKINRKKLFSLFVIFLYTFFYGKYYFNNVFGFFGNSFRTITFGYIVLLLFDLFKSNDIKDKILIYIASLAACGFSSSSVFALVFMCFGLAFGLPKKDKFYFAEAAILMALPLFNLIVVLKKTINIKIGAEVLILCVILVLINKYLVYLFRNKYFRIFVLAFGFVTMAYMSYKVTNNFFDFTSFFDNNGEMADMYFNYCKPFGISAKNYYILLFDVLFIVYLIFNRNEYTTMVLSLMIVIFNPFCVSYLASMNGVYHRTYDLFFNPFTFVLFFDYILNKINNKYFYYGSMVFLLGLFALNTDYINPSYYHETYVPSKDYNGQYRMDNDEIEIIRQIDNDSKYRGLSNPYICTPNLLTQGDLSGIYLYTRGYITWYVSDYKYEVYKMFYPDRYKTFEYDINNIYTYLWESNIDYLVVDKSYEYYDESEGTYDYLVRRVYECQIPFYENDSYAVFYFGDEVAYD